MKRLQAKVAAVALLSLGCSAPAAAAPPTVTPSPGYDARLSEQRAARAAAPSLTQDQPAPRRRHVRRARPNY